jgi:hypothetical protein
MEHVMAQLMDTIVVALQGGPHQEIGVAPIVMGALGRARRQSGLDAGRVAGMLGDERANLQQASTDRMSMASHLPGGPGGSLASQLGGIAGGLFGEP